MGAIERSGEGVTTRLGAVLPVEVNAPKLTCLLVALVGIVSLNAVFWSSGKFGDLPPGIHDEYSYLFEAQTVLAGRIWFPSHERMPELFDQVHVLNEGKFVSRYLPGTAFWMAPFVAIGQPYLGHWLAGVVIAVLVFGIGRELGGNLCGFVAGMATALAPGMAFFGNFLLSHHPTLLGLMLFLFSVLRMRSTLSWGWAFAAGCGLAFAILCRPLTAVAVAFPFAVVLVQRTRELGRNHLRPGIAVLAQSEGDRHIFPGDPVGDDQRTSECRPFRSGKLSQSPGRERLRAGLNTAFPFVAAFAAPVCVTAIGIFFYNQAITGSGWKSPWSLYNEIYTPSHAYGFGNAVRGAGQRGPKVMQEYDRWAENLTAEKALKNCGTRLMESWNWTLGAVPLGMATIIVLLSPAGRSIGWPLLASIASLHAAYFPYWFTGILGWHYVFESLVLWALVFGLATRVLVDACNGPGRRVLLERQGDHRYARRCPHIFSGDPVGDDQRTDECRPFTAGKMSQSPTCERLRVLVDQWNGPARWLMVTCWLTVALLHLAAAYVPFDGAGTSWFDRRIAPYLQMRRRHGEFRRLVEQTVVHRPALVLVEQPPVNFHLDFVVNSPGLDGPVLFGRYWPERHKLSDILDEFPDRAVYRFRDRRWEIEEVKRGGSSEDAGRR